MCNLTSYVKEMVWTEPTNIRTAGIDTNRATMFTLLLELNVVWGVWTKVDTVRIAK